MLTDLKEELKRDNNSEAEKDGPKRNDRGSMGLMGFRRVLMEFKGGFDGISWVFNGIQQ
jgi:hypothetical protein